ncbi:hypothetical protein GCM10009715_41880 [Paeniglutamicibacter psychrophenolicus]|uniref:Uncharacterized protein n=1 Tax=Paeniglutamicibacter psychrophenolicus TaxID=257454 RepID=A0ABS4WJT8_9MICC|nr:hypothetical protein [Paeniglutamicibacter psychrophenolicus]MBP2376474.1 hypothetical protein [Paeniglutamicibacter psychrophenolicus]
METSQDANPWLEAARSVPAPPVPEVNRSAPDSPVQGSPLQDAPAVEVASEQTRAVLVAAHGGAGTTTWSHILGAVDGGNVESWVSEREPGDIPAVLALRASVEGINTTKSLLAQYGVDAFAAALVIPAAPGKLPRRIASELRILGGAISVIHAPWVPALLLKRAAHAASSDLSPKELTKLTTMLANQGIQTQGETT